MGIFQPASFPVDFQSAVIPILSILMGWAIYLLTLSCQVFLLYVLYSWKFFYHVFHYLRLGRHVSRVFQQLLDWLVLEISGYVKLCCF